MYARLTDTAAHDHDTADAHDTAGQDDARAASRALAVVANVVLSLLACAYGVWRATRWWSVPSRTAAALVAALVVALAEVGVYAAYTLRVAEAERRERSRVEVRSVLARWKVGDGGGGGDGDAHATGSDFTRRRH
jgi:hypothetical protein